MVARKVGEENWHENIAVSMPGASGMFILMSGGRRIIEAVDGAKVRALPNWQKFL